MKLEEIENILNDTRFILSYGETSKILPIGLYKVQKLLFACDSPYKYGVSDNFDYYVKLIRVDDDCKDKNNFIYMPLSSLRRLLNLEVSDNNYFAKQLTGSENCDESLMVLSNQIKDFYKRKESSPIIFNGKASLNELDATYEVNGNPLGTNYTIVPFSYGKQKVKVMYMDAEPEPEKEDKLTLSL